MEMFCIIGSPAIGAKEPKIGNTVVALPPGLYIAHSFSSPVGQSNTRVNKYGIMFAITQYI